MLAIGGITRYPSDLMSGYSDVMRRAVRWDPDCLRETPDEAVGIGIDVFLEFLEVRHGGGRCQAGNFHLELPLTESCWTTVSDLQYLHHRIVFDEGAYRGIPIFYFDRPRRAEPRAPLALQFRICRAPNTETIRIRHLVFITTSGLKYGCIWRPPYRSR
jgi:hypothetical protein